MRIRVQTEMTPTSPGYEHAMIIESIEELEEQHERGEIETHAYLMKKRALIRML